jgi:hypothetical protein
MQYGQSWICTECKPIFLQRLQEGLNPAGYQLWRSGKKLVMQRDAELPERCIKCNAPTTGYKLKRNLYWHPPLLYLTIFISILVYAIIAVIVRKKATVFVGLCPRHRTSCLRDQWIAGGLFMGSVALMVGGFSATDPRYVGAGLLGILGVLISMLYALAVARTVWASRIDETHVWLKGVCADFLAGLPEWGGYN